MKLIPKDFAPKTELDGAKVIVSDITDSQKKNLIASALQFIASQPKKPMKESIKDQIKQAVMEVLQEKKLTKAEKNKKEDRYIRHTEHLSLNLLYRHLQNHCC